VIGTAERRAVEQVEASVVCRDGDEILVLVAEEDRRRVEVGVGRGEPVLRLQGVAIQRDACARVRPGAAAERDGYSVPSVPNAGPAPATFGPPVAHVVTGF
jgi:hypothetical protein